MYGAYCVHAYNKHPKPIRTRYYEICDALLQTYKFRVYKTRLYECKLFVY